ncbi:MULTISPECIES: zinc transporter ZntB [Aliiglaciecola]|uniref:zinc transporter ZntB n=1 Tax=Aliiglaciecola TaxID=1406885 RepID=UPI001C09083E|nr:MULTISPECIES: zinc transporter ZntB [Aliiglaciecola]MBU2878816.1 zinc transporter ZntB [Aliiglaciecola lipolytica]MDO6711286.1 zinc transporter ZntB [Aliiglaciecola sp. 2_MG-2023]MDO6752265.1 zinc transporter ZntB [Aliiglaciecola sp. 1_MG-2023]
MSNHSQLDSSQTSLIWSLFVDEKGVSSDGKTADIFTPEISAGYNWVHLQADTLDAWDTMKGLGLSDVICDSLSALETRPRALLQDNGILIYLRGINYNPDSELEDMVSLRIWFNDHHVVTARRRDRILYSVQDTKSMIESGDAPTDTADFILLLIGKIASRISEVVEALDEELSAFEAEGGLESSDRYALSMVRRKSAAVRRYLAPQRDALDNLYRMAKFFSQEQAYELRDLTDRMTRYVEDLDLAKERSMVLQDELRNRIAEQQGMRMYVLSLVTAIFLPLSFLTGIFGMNVAGLPGTENPEAFNYLASSMVIVAIIMLAAMLWKKWL